jgi:hypothetical protein
VLRPGNASGSAGALGILRRLMARVSDAFPKAVPATHLRFRYKRIWSKVPINASA